MNGFSQLLNEFSQLCVQNGCLRFCTDALELSLHYFLVGGRATGIGPAVKLFPMEPNTLGRKFGIGIRVASRMILDRAAQASPPPAKTAPSIPVYPAHGKAVARGARKFGESMWKPFAHASGVLWLQITGLFFALFTIVFASNIYKLRQYSSAGVGHSRFLTYAVVTLVFAYFTFSSFYRAGRKEKMKRRTKQ